MKSITITRLRRELFTIVEEVGRGETVEILRNGKAVARISPIENFDWRDRVHSVPKLLVNAESAFAPLDEEWKPYT